MAEVQVKHVGWWHERFADWLIANPHLKLKDAAREFNVSVPWLSVVKNSGAFKEIYTERSNAHTGKVIADSATALAGVREKTETMTELALDALNERLAKDCNAEQETVPRRELLEIVDKGMARLGYGATKNSPPPISITADKVAIVNRAELSAARDKIMLASGVETNQIAVRELVHDKKD